MFYGNILTFVFNDIMKKTCDISSWFHMEYISSLSTRLIGNVFTFTNFLTLKKVKLLF